MKSPAYMQLHDNIHKINWWQSIDIAGKCLSLNALEIDSFGLAVKKPEKERQTLTYYLILIYFNQHFLVQLSI